MTSRPRSALVCSGCGASPASHEPFPFACPNAGVGDVDHVLVRVLDTERVEFPEPDGASSFETYRGLLHSLHRAESGGVGDEEFVGIVRELDEAVRAVDGKDFRPTPFSRSEYLSEHLGFSAQGGVWVKDETGNVAGSHKARHLMGVLLHLEVAERLGLSSSSSRPDLAIASCGNAALAAAVVAAAAQRRLRVFVPVDADPVITARLAELGAEVVSCPRDSSVRGDPTYIRLKKELAAGALAFTCQGNLNGLAIEGGETLGYEIASSLAAEQLELDHLLVQVGGGALASSCMQALAEAASLGVIPSRPAISTVQTEGAHPLERAYARVKEHLPRGLGEAGRVDEALQAAARARSHYMWAWETEPKSLATGILDDETYDWLAVVRGMFETGGRPLVVSEQMLSSAHELGRAAGYVVDATGSSGLAGLLEMRESEEIAPQARVAVLFTGIER
jgi:threonine synthase